MKKFSQSLLIARLKALRGERSQKVMSALCGMKQPMYARYESGATLPSAELLFRLCLAFGCTADYLLGLSDVPPNLRSSAPPRETKIRTGDNSPVTIVKGDHNKISQTINQPSKKRIRK